MKVRLLTGVFVGGRDTPQDPPSGLSCIGGKYKIIKIQFQNYYRNNISVRSPIRV
jgi:hypothetical protein